MVIKTALISGPMYDQLYTRLEQFSQQTGFEVEIGFRGDHPALNHHLAELTDMPYDLVSTHSKYAPSQAGFLAGLDNCLTAADLDDFVPSALELARIEGKLYGLPRNIDVRLLHYRTDLIHTPPATWDDLLTLARHLTRPADFYGFVFPGRESGLFGTFFELVEMAGVRMFPPDLIPQIENEGGRWAINLLRKMVVEKIVSPDITHWHYDRVHEHFRNGNAAMIGDWPGFFSAYSDPAVSKVAGRFRVVPYPVGPSGRTRTYGGGHTFALTRRGIDKPEAISLLRFLTAPEQQLSEARRGSVPVRVSVLTAIKAEATDAERERLETLDHVIREQILIPPKFARYPQVEDVVWTTIQAAITSQLDVDAALHQMTERISAIVRGEHGE